MSTDTVKRFIDAQNNLVIQHSDFSLRALFDMAENDSIDLKPHYQRRDRWKREKQSALIESFILNVPVPPVYLSEDDFGKYSVIDGKQRITAIRDFLGRRLKLFGLKRFKELEGAGFDDLPNQIQNALSVRPYIRVITLLRQTDPMLKYEVFLRLNTGGEKLLAQEIRNVAFSGSLNDLLFELSSTEFLWQRMKIKNQTSTAYQKMEDVEHVLRFFTLDERWKNTGQVASEEMDSFMRDNRDASESRLSGLRSKFLTSLETCKNIWGSKAFYKPQGSGWRGQFISPIFDAEMVAASQFTASQVARLVRNREAIIAAFMKTFRDDPLLVKSVSQATNNPASVKKRISTTLDIMKAAI